MFAILSAFFFYRILNHNFYIFIVVYFIWNSKWSTEVFFPWSDLHLLCFDQEGGVWWLFCCCHTFIFPLQVTRTVYQLHIRLQQSCLLFFLDRLLLWPHWGYPVLLLLQESPPPQEQRVSGAVVIAFVVVCGRESKSFFACSLQSASIDVACFFSCWW